MPHNRCFGKGTGPALAATRPAELARRHFPAGRPVWGLVLAMNILALQACDRSQEQVSATGSQAYTLTAYRIRTDASAGLNEDNWAAPQDTPAVINADQPFRLRFEVESPELAGKPEQFQFQYRRNEGDWQPLDAEDFPYPSRELTLDFTGYPGSPDKLPLAVMQGEQTTLAWQTEAAKGEGYLHLFTKAQPLLALGEYRTYWEAEEYKAILRLQSAAQAGLLFGYQDLDNHYRLMVEGDGPLTLIQRNDGNDAILATFDTAVKTDQWIEVAVVHDGRKITVEYEWDPILTGKEWRVELESPPTASVVGIFLPAESRADVQALEVSADASTPRASIVSTTAFTQGEASVDLLTGSAQAFRGGEGLNLTPRTEPWPEPAAQGEWEVPLVVRYFADGAKTNQNGDLFHFRVVDSSGKPLAASVSPAVTLNVPDGHLGGTFVETPGRLGPWKTAMGDLYFLMEPSETDNMMMIVRSTDGGISWSEVDGEQRPATGDLEGVATAFDGRRIHIIHQTSDEVLYHVFRTSDDQGAGAWEIRDEHLASPAEPPVQVADIALRSNGSVVGIYGDLHKIRYQVRSPEGEWGAPHVIGTDGPQDLSGPVLVRGRDDVIHLAYTGSDGTAWYRRILPGDELTPAQLIASGLGNDTEDAGGILPLVYLPQTNEVSIIYRLDSGQLWERRAGDQLSPAVLVTDRPVVRNAADSEQVGADAVGYAGRVHVLFIEEETGRLFHTGQDNKGHWRLTPIPVVDGENVLWVRGTVLEHQGGGAVYGFVYDGGSNGGSGMNRYTQIPLDSPE